MAFNMKQVAPQSCRDLELLKISELELQNPGLGFSTIYFHQDLCDKTIQSDI